MTNLCATLFALPGVCADLYLHYGYDWIYSMIHLAVPLVPAVMYLLDENVDNAVIDFSNFANAVSMGAISFNFNNYFGIYAAISHFTNHFIFKKKEIRDVPKEIIFNLGMCFYTYFAYRTLADSFVRIH